MKLDQIKLLKVGDIVIDKISKAEFVITGINEGSSLPLCLQLISEIKDPIYLNYVATTTTAYAEKGDAYWIYLSHSIAYGDYSYPTVYVNRRIMTCEDLVLKSTSPWIKPTENVEKDKVGEILPLQELKKVVNSKISDAIDMINSKLIKSASNLETETTITREDLKPYEIESSNAKLISEIEKASYKVKLTINGELVISGW